mgnify:CR=1 FL=1|tara:strand:- start:524 stop:910 length:387 start_codon:yes stop_codon:yes gene_type:complete
MKNIVIDGVEYTPVIKKDEVIAKPIVLHKSLILDFEVYPTDLGEMTWDKAKKACANLGDGWRLPTKDELNLIYENKNVVGGFANNGYWSSTEIDYGLAWNQDFYNGVQYFFNKSSTFYVRAVRALTKK